MNTSHSTEEAVRIYDLSRVYDGYTLFAQHASTDLWLMDIRGRLVHHWALPSAMGSGVTLLSNGNHLRLTKTGQEPTAFLGTVGGILAEVDWDGNVVWQHEDPYLHHDFCLLPNGNFLLNRHVKIPESIARRVRGGIPQTTPEGGLWGNAFREITREGKVVWEWLGHEHLDPDTDIACPLCPLTIWGYVNGIDVFPNGDIVASFRHLNNLMIIDRQTGEIKWRWGKWELGHQHHPTVLPTGNILVFDNGYHRLPPYEYRYTISSETYSRVLEVNPRTGEIEWEYRDKDMQHFYSAACSGAQRLPNGNTLICEALKGHIFEVTPKKEIVWEFTNPFYGHKERLGHTNYVFKALRYGTEYPAFQGRGLENKRFDWGVLDKPVSETAPPDAPGESKMAKRLAELGY